MLGAGSWGTALAIALAGCFDAVTLWARDGEKAARMDRMRVNEAFLPSFVLPPSVRVTSNLHGAVEAAHFVLLAAPSHALRSVVKLFKVEVPIVSATKGLEGGTLLRMSEVIGECGVRDIAVLSGPTFAREIAAGEPAALVVASHNAELANEIQRVFATDSLRLYTTGDVTGVELGAALKNVIAIGAGICEGLGLGGNTLAALVTRGLAEITRLAVKMGAQERTLSGLAGLGDLVLTATGDLSRNRQVGIQLGRGRKLDEVLSEMTNVAEGVGTCRAAHQLGLRKALDLPIMREMYQVLYEAKEPRAAIRDLMDRRLTSESG